MSDRAHKLATAAIIACSLIFFLWLSSFGPSHRVFSLPARAIAVEKPSDAFSVWQESGVKGRVLYLFDSRLNAKAVINGVVGGDNYVYAAATGNIVREIHHVLPARDWPRASASLDEKPAAAKLGGTYRLTVESTPVIVSPLESLPAAKEKALVVINTAAWSDSELKSIASLINGGGISYDILTASGGGSDELTGGGGPSGER